MSQIYLLFVLFRFCVRHLVKVYSWFWSRWKLLFIRKNQQSNDFCNENFILVMYLICQMVFQKYFAGVLHSFSIKNIFYDKMELRLFYFYFTKWLLESKRWKIELKCSLVKAISKMWVLFLFENSYFCVYQNMCICISKYIHFLSVSSNTQIVEICDITVMLSKLDKFPLLIRE